MLQENSSNSFLSTEKEHLCFVDIQVSTCRNESMPDLIRSLVNFQTEVFDIWNFS